MPALFTSVPRPQSARLVVACALVVTAIAAMPALAGPTAATRVINFDVGSRGRVTGDVNQLATVAAATYTDGRGWSLGGSLVFRRVASGGQFHLLLAAPDVVGARSGCSAAYSCQSGADVLINDARWRTPPPSWTRSVGEYRSYVINHETGHWLGLQHLRCGGPGQPAPVMQQQSISLQGCAANVWPLTAERQHVASLQGVTIRLPVRPTVAPVPAVAPSHAPVVVRHRRFLSPARLAPGTG